MKFHRLKYIVKYTLFSLVDGLLARSRYPEGPATGHLDTGFFFGFPVSESECSDGSQDSKLLLHASHVALLPPDGATARGGPWPPLQCASRPLDSLLCLSIHLTL